MKYDELTHLIIDAATEVHRELGNGYPEDIYRRALSIELQLYNLSFLRNKVVDIKYKNCHIGTHKPDFLVDARLIVEVKACNSLEDVHLAQAMNYLKAFHLEKGLLINFGTRRLQIKSVQNSKLINRFSSLAEDNLTNIKSKRDHLSFNHSISSYK